MKLREITAYVFSVVNSLALMVVIFLTSIELTAFDLAFYKKEYSKLNTPEVIGISEQDLLYTTEQLLAYIRGTRDNLMIRAEINGRQRQVFNRREIDHMVDVRRLFVQGWKLRNICLGLVILSSLAVWAAARKSFLRFLARGYLAGTLIFILLLAAVGFMITRDFRWFWTNMHFLLFTNDLWQLNPETDILIRMVPEQFFFDMVVRILVMFGFTAVMLAVLCAGFLRYFKKVEERL